MPARKEITGYRYYSFEQVSQGLLLQRLSGLGFGIQEMRAIVDVIDGRSDCSYLPDHRGQDRRRQGAVEGAEGSGRSWRE